MIKTSKEILKSKFVGSFLGTAVGDAMGARYEGLPYGISFTKTNMGRYTDDTQKKLKTIEGLLHFRPNRSKVVKELGNGIEAFNSVPTAIYCFARTESFQESILDAISLGGDTDTIAAMTGAISGASYGAQGIPNSWKNKLEDREKGRSHIEKLAKELWSIKYG